MIYQLQVPGPVPDVEEVRILEWHGVVGQIFEPGELVVELETHKAIVEVRAGKKSVMRNILCAEGDWQKIGAALALFSDEPDEPIPDDASALTSMLVDFEIT